MTATARLERDGRNRRVREVDRHGAVVAELDWAATGLTRARVRIPDGSWLALEPRATAEAPWGLSDRLRGADDGAVTVFGALDYEAIDRIPVLAAPARLPPGGGTAVLNLLAGLAADQGRMGLAYEGPYPTEQLFLALLESFRYDGAPADPLAAFMRGELTWTPAPHERVFAPGGVYVQLRGRVEKVVARGVAYYREDWQGVRRHAPRRVRDTDGEARCSLWALDTALEDHAALSPAGDVRRLIDPAADPSPARAMAPALVAGLVAAVVATSAPPLAAAIRDVAAATTFEWGPVTGDLIRTGANHLRVSGRLERLLAQRLAATPSRADRIRLAFAALAELALLLGDTLRPQAQSLLATSPPATQSAALQTVSVDDGAPAMAAAVESLLEPQR